MERFEDLVIAGAGYSGLPLAIELGEILKAHPNPDRHRVCVVSPSPVQHLQCELYKVLRTGRPRVLPIEAPLKRLNIRWTEGWVSQVNTKDRLLKLRGDSHSIRYNQIVSAIGSEPILPPIEGLKSQIHPSGMAAKRAFLFASTSDALGIRMRLGQMRWSEASGTRDEFAVIIGAGPNGLEIAGELAALRGRNRRRRVVVIDQNPELLPGFSPIARRLLKAQLSELGIETLLGSPATHCSSTELQIKNGQVVPWHLLIVSAGQRTRSLWESQDPAHIETGDLAAPDPLHRTAQRAVQHAEHLAQRVASDWKMIPDPGEFQDQDWGLLISLGPHHGIARIGPPRSRTLFQGFASGRSVPLLKTAAEIRYRSKLGFYRQSISDAWT
jgi:NADH dehydrogenase FAD-containing subunit